LQPIDGPHVLDVTGVQMENALAFSFAIERDGVAAICSFTGRREEHRLETVWHVVSTDKPWPHAVQTNADNFQRLD